MFQLHLLLIPLLIIAATATQTLLEDVRHLVKGVPYTQQQRIELAQAARNVLNVLLIDPRYLLYNHKQLLLVK